MKFFFLGNGSLGLRCLQWLLSTGDQVVGLALHEPRKRRCGEQLIAAAGLPPDRIVDGWRTGEPEVLTQVASLKAEVAVSVLFGHILRAPFLSLFPGGVVNLHPSLLPYNRGAYPNVWSIVEGTPAGATLHYIDTGVDTGDVIAQREVPVTLTDTGATLYDKLEEAAFETFRANWPSVRAGTAPRRPQTPGGTSHRVKDVAAIDRIDLDGTYRARDLINLIRARTFPPHRGAYFEESGRRVYVSLTLEEREEENEDK